MPIASVWEGLSSVASPSQPKTGRASANPPVHAYLAAYGLWFFTFLLGLLVAVAVRDLYQLAMFFTALDRYAVHVANQIGAVVLVLLVLVLTVTTEAYYRNGVPRQQILRRFGRVVAVLALVLVGAQALRLALEVVAGSVNLISVLLFVVVLLIYWIARSAAQVRPAVPAKTHSSRWAVSGPLMIVVLAAGAILIALPIKSPLNPYDEGLALVNGMRVLNGDIPFRDYWAIYPPGQSYVLAAIFGVAGQNIFVERVYDTVVRVLLALVLYVTAARVLCSWRWALAPYMAISVLLASAWFYGYAVFPALLFGFAALLLGFRFLETARTRWLAGAGLLLGVTTLFRIDLGAYTAAAISVTLVLKWLLLSAGDETWGRRTRDLIVAVLVLTGAARADCCALLRLSCALGRL